MKMVYKKYKEKIKNTESIKREMAPPTQGRGAKFRNEVRNPIPHGYRLLVLVDEAKGGLDRDGAIFRDGGTMTLERSVHDAMFGFGFSQVTATRDFLDYTTV